MEQTEMFHLNDVDDIDDYDDGKNGFVVVTDDSKTMKSFH